MKNIVLDSNKTYTEKRARELSHELMNALYGGKNLKECLEIAAAYFGNPICFLDKSFHLAAITDEGIDDIYWNQISREKSLTQLNLRTVLNTVENTEELYFGKSKIYKLDYLKSLDTNIFHADTANYDMVEYEKLEYEYMTCGVSMGGDVLGSLNSMSYYRKYTDEDIEVFDVIARFCAIFSKFYVSLKSSCMKKQK